MRARKHKLPPGMSWGEIDAIEAALRKELQTDDGMNRWFDCIFGCGTWIYDDAEDLWVAKNRSHKGPGSSFFVMRRGGDWWTTTMPAAN